MADPTLDELRTELHRRTDVYIPPAPVTEILDRAAATRRTRTRRRLLVAAAGIAVVVGLGLTIATTAGAGEHASPSKKSHRTEHAGPPLSVNDLPVGKPSDFATLSGRTITQDAKTYELAKTPEHFVQVGEYVVVSYAGGRIDAIDVAGARSRTLTENGTIPVAGYNGQVAWTTPDDKSVVVQDLRTWDSDDQRTQAFPVHPQCCDDPFDLYGITESNQLIGGTGSDRLFVWDTRGTRAPQKITGISDDNGWIAQVTPQEIVLYPGNDGSSVGEIHGARYVQNDVLDYDAKDYAGVTKYLVYSDEVNALQVVDRVWTHGSAGGKAVGPHPEHALTLALPLSIALAEDGVHWEMDASGEPTHVVLDISSASGHIPTYQVRCELSGGTCELAGKPVLAAAGPTVKLNPGPGVTTDDLALVRSFVTVAQAADADGIDLTHLPLGPATVIGLGDIVNQETGTDLSDISGWRIETVGGYAGRDGNLSALDQLRGYLATSSDSTLGNRALDVYAGNPPGCAGAQPTPMSGTDDDRRITIQPDDVASCGDWFSIDLYVDDTGVLKGVKLELKEP